MSQTLPTGVEYPLVSASPVGIIAGPMPHLLEPGVLPMPSDKLTAHNHPTGLWPALTDSGKIPTKTVENANSTTPKATLASIPGPASPSKVGETAESPAVNGPALTSIPTTFLAAPKEVAPKELERATITNIITAPKDTSPVVRLMGLKTGQRMGHGPDYRWVAGVLDKHQKGGFWTLRYADYSADDAWGGKVRLIEDPRLANFKNGDVVYLEGELLAPSGGSADSSGYPPYKISQIQTLDSGR